MGKRIARGAVIGIFLGVICAIAIGNIMYFNKIMARQNQEYASMDSMAVVSDYEEGSQEVFNESGMSYGIECNDLQDVVLRFHVRANSNSDEDISLKYSVRDAILYEYGNILQSDMSRDEVFSYLAGEIEHIEEIATLTLNNLGYSYPVKVYFSTDYFPIRQYGEMVFPAGYYDALRVDIGKAEGENFWCILYPMMCYTLDSGAVVSSEDGEKLKEVLGEEEYEKLFVKRELEEEDEVKIKFKFLEWLGL